MQIADNPVVALNHVVAVAMVRGPRLGLDGLEALRADERIAVATGSTPSGRTCWR